MNLALFLKNWVLKLFLFSQRLSSVSRSWRQSSGFRRWMKRSTTPWRRKRRRTLTASSCRWCGNASAGTCGFWPDGCHIFGIPFWLKGLSQHYGLVKSPLDLFKLTWFSTSYLINREMKILSETVCLTSIPACIIHHFPDTAVSVIAK